VSLLSRFGWDKGVLLLAAFTLFVGRFQSPRFLTTSNMTFVIENMGEIMLIAFSMTLVIIAGHIDLSVASTAALASCTLGFVWEHFSNMALAILAALVVGILCGLLNGLLITRLGLQSLAVTIGTLGLYRGLCYALLGDKQVSSFPAAWTNLGILTIAHSWIPYVAIPIVVFGVVFGVVLHATRAGRWIFAVGQSKEAARFVGIPVDTVVLRLFVVNGFMAGFAGVVYSMRFASSRPDGAVGMELAIIASALFAGVSIFGGVGTMWGVAGAVLFLGAIRSLLQLKDVPSNALTIVTGSLLLLSVIVPAVVARIPRRYAFDRSLPPSTEGRARRRSSAPDSESVVLDHVRADQTAMRNAVRRGRPRRAICSPQPRSS
jgi:rhamnose transport system permease protein